MSRANECNFADPIVHYDSVGILHCKKLPDSIANSIKLHAGWKVATVDVTQSLCDLNCLEKDFKSIQGLAFNKSSDQEEIDKTPNL